MKINVFLMVYKGLLRFIVILGDVKNSGAEFVRVNVNVTVGRHYESEERRLTQTNLRFGYSHSEYSTGNTFYLLNFKIILQI